MNVLFHFSTGVGLSILLSDTQENIQSPRQKFQKGLSAIVLGVISHGVLDYAPHCYPINSTLDISLGFMAMLAYIYFTKPQLRYLSICALVACILPDLIDLLPSMLNNQFGTSLPILDKIFPWHWKSQSGSIYNGDCNVSNINHILCIVAVILIIWNKKSEAKHLLNLT